MPQHGFRNRQQCLPGGSFGIKMVKEAGASSVGPRRELLPRLESDGLWGSERRVRNTRPGRKISLAALAPMHGFPQFQALGHIAACLHLYE